LLLQALGLKLPFEEIPTPGKKFLSPIESCSLNGGCKNITKPDPKFIELLSKNSIKCVAHGHVPFCTTVPLIRKEDSVWFLSCDTSNGSRPKINGNTELTLNQVPLGYIQADGLGIASIGGTTLSSDNTLGVSMDGKTQDYYKFMVKHFKFTDNKPVVQYNGNTGSVVEYPETNLVMDSTNIFKPTTASEQSGGKSRKNKKNRKSNKSNKKGGLKKLTRKLKLKSQKFAFAKPHCNHCK